jgi:hypothetical protein
MKVAGHWWPATPCFAVETIAAHGVRPASKSGIFSYHGSALIPKAHAVRRYGTSGVALQ